MRSSFTPLLQLSSIRWDSAVRGASFFFSFRCVSPSHMQIFIILNKTSNTLTACFKSHNWIEGHLKCPCGEKHALGQTASSHRSPFRNNYRMSQTATDEGFKMVISSKKWPGIPHFFFSWFLNMTGRKISPVTNGKQNVVQCQFSWNVTDPWCRIDLVQSEKSQSCIVLS